MFVLRFKSPQPMLLAVGHVSYAPLAVVMIMMTTLLCIWTRNFSSLFAFLVAEPHSGSNACSSEAEHKDVPA